MDVVMVIAPKGFRDEEYAHPKRVLESRGARVVTASAARGECVGKLGMKAWATISVAEAADTPWDGLLFVGGAGASVFFDDEDAHRLAHLAATRGAVVSAICIAPSILAHAGLLNGARATAFPSQEQDLKEHGALWTGEHVTIDGRFVTGDGPQSATAFGEAVADVLGLPRV